MYLSWPLRRLWRVGGGSAEQGDEVWLRIVKFEVR